MSNERKEHNHPREKVIEKPKDFKNAITQLFKELNSYKTLIIVALLLAMISSLLSLSAPNRLSSLTDEISKGIGINKDNIEALNNDLTQNINKDNFYSTIQGILNIDLINKDQKDLTSFDALSNVPEDYLAKILTESTYNDILVTKEDKITLIKALSSFDPDSKDYSFIEKLPTSIQKILFPTSKIKNIDITTEDKVKFITIMSKMDENTSSNEKYKLIEKLPNSIQTLINPTMNMNKIKKITIFLAIIYVVSALFNYIQGISMVNVANKFAKSLRSKISIKINKLPLKYFDRTITGDILSRVTNDVDTIAQSLNQSLATLVSSLTLFIGSIIMMFVTNYIMAITAIVSSLLGFVLMFLILGKSQKYFTKRQEELGALNGYIEEMYSGLNIIKTSNAKEEVDKKFDNYNNKVYECDRKSQFLSGLMPPIMSFVGNLGYVAVCIVGSLLVSNNTISFGVIVAFMMYVRQFTNPLSQIAQAMTSLQTTAASSERVFEFLNEEELPSEKSLDKKLDKKKVKGQIEFNHVSFGYDKDKIIIKDFTAIAKPGQKVAIVGPTGAGKTTMVNLLMKFYDITKGDIKIDGVSIKELKRENIHSLFTMVLQDTWLFEGTVKENIIYNRKNISDKKVEEVCKVVGVDHFIKTLPNSYDSKLSSNEEISTGQKQLLTIARGMVEDSPFLILDEATSNVDTRTEELVQKAMDKLMENKTSFIIAHRLSTIRNADLILVMKDGNIIEQGNHNKLMKENGFYANLYNSQFENIN